MKTAKGASLSFLASPADLALGAALRDLSAAEVFAAVTGTDSRRELALSRRAEGRALAAVIGRWRIRLALLPSVAMLAAWQYSGMRIICPGDTEWPSQLDDLGDARPLVLWVRGVADLRFSCLNSVSIVGSRAASGYGNHVALEMAATLAERGVSVISGGAYTTDYRLCAPSECCWQVAVLLAIFHANLGPAGGRDEPDFHGGLRPAPVQRVTAAEASQEQPFGRLRMKARYESLATWLSPDDAALDHIDAIVPPGTNTYDPNEYWKPADLTDAALRRRPLATRSAA
jgi:hypothetical protein